MASRGAALPPRSGPRDLAAVAGLIFSIVMVLVVLLFRSAGAVGSAELAALEAGQGLSGPERLITGVTVNELLVPFGVRHIELLFPAWITILSLYLFIKDPGGQPRTQPQTQA